MAVKKTAGNAIGQGKPGPGRPKGVPNKTTTALKDMILGALNKSGGEDYLIGQAKDNPTAFLTLVGKVLPMTVAGDPENPLKTVHRIELIGVEPSGDRAA